MTSSTIADTLPASGPTPASRPRHHTDYRPTLGWPVTDALTVAWRNLTAQRRQPQVLLFAAVQPIMFIVLFRYVFGGAINVPGGNYVNYLMAGVFVQTVVFGGVATAIGITEDLAGGVIDRFRTLPMSRSAVLLGRVLSDVVRNALAVTVMIAVGMAVGFRPASLPSLLGAVALLLALGVAFSYYFALVGLLVKNAEAAQAGGFLVIFPLTFASSAFVPTDSMPAALRAFADHQPVTAAIDAVRALVLGQPWADAVAVALVWTAGLTAVLATLAVLRYRRIS